MNKQKIKKDLEETIKDKVNPLLEETMEKSWGITIPKLESDISDQLKNPHLNIYVSFSLPFGEARNRFKKAFIKKELQMQLGNISQLAKVLGMDRRRIHRTIKELDINLGEIRKKEDADDDGYEAVIKQTIRSTLDQYKEIIQPEKMERGRRRI